LYAGGSFTTAGGIPVKNIAKWDGVSWQDVGGGVFYTGATTVSTMLTYGSALYAGGTFSNAGTVTVNNIAKWDGANWSDVGGGTRYTGATTVSTMLNFNSALIVGGTFDSLGTTASNYIGFWDGSNWSSLGTGTNSSVLALASLGDTLYAGGIFTGAGTILSPFIAEWIPEVVEAIMTGVDEEEFPPYSIYPNPVKDHLIIKANNPEISKNANHTFLLFDIVGNKVLEERDVKGELFFNRTEIRNGLYIYRIEDSDHTIIKQGKLSFN
jgi:hypothetical protein